MTVFDAPITLSGSAGSFGSSVRLLPNSLPQFSKPFASLQQRNWGIEFQEGQIVITEETLDAVLTLLQNKRLHSELTDETFDVDSAKRLEM